MTGPARVWLRRVERGTRGFVRRTNLQDAQVVIQLEDVYGRGVGGRNRHVRAAGGSTAEPGAHGVQHHAHKVAALCTQVQ